MSNIREKTINYFSPPENYFWKWAEKGDVIEWSNGKTLCFRSELSEMLEALKPYGWLPLGTVLLVIAACKRNFGQHFDGHFFREIPKELAQTEKNFGKSTDVFVKRSVNRSIDMLGRILNLPEKLKSPPQRLHLLVELAHFTKKTIPENEAEAMLNAFDSGNLTNYFFQGKKKNIKAVLLQDLHCLREAEQHFSAENAPYSLETKLKTSVYDLPEAAEVELPVAPVSGDLLQQLRANEQTKNLALLTQQLLAAFHIPIHSLGTSDQPMGGVSDISNKGDFDRLLLSELAYDDASLMARLVNNEALYIQRETPPQHVPEERRVVIDTALRMWGTNRIYAIAAALACVYKAPEHMNTRVFAGKDLAFREVDFSDKEGVMLGLASLSSELESHAMMQAFLAKHPADQEQETIFITDEGWLKRDPARVEQILAKRGLSYIILLGRTGTLELHQFRNGRRKLISQAQLDLDESLFATPKKKAVKKRKTQLELPLFYQQETLPLYFPTLDMSVADNNFFPVGKWGFIGINAKYRLLYWVDRNRGAQELVSRMENGTYAFGYDGEQYAFLLLYNLYPEQVKVYTIDLAEESVFSREIPIPDMSVYHCRFFEEKFFLSSRGGKAIEIDPFRASYKIRSDATANRIINMPRPASEHSLSYLRRQINKGYNVLGRPNRVEIGGLTDTFLQLGSRYLQPRLKLEDAPADVRRNAIEAKLVNYAQPFDNPWVNLMIYEWEDGSQAIVDNRGFIHLRSADETLSEVTIVMVLGKMSAAWAASDALCAGNPYFLRPKMGVVAQMTPTKFYKQFIQPFIDRIFYHVTETHPPTEE